MFIRLATDWDFAEVTFACTYIWINFNSHFESNGEPLLLPLLLLLLTMLMIWRNSQTLIDSRHPLSLSLCLARQIQILIEIKQTVVQNKLSDVWNLPGKVKNWRNTIESFSQRDRLILSFNHRSRSNSRRDSNPRLAFSDIKSKPLSSLTNTRWSLFTTLAGYAVKIILVRCDSRLVNCDRRAFMKLTITWKIEFPGLVRLICDWEVTGQLLMNCLSFLLIQKVTKRPEKAYKVWFRCFWVGR